jgi:hypothetical protein
MPFGEEVSEKKVSLEVWSVLRSILKDSFSFSQIKDIVGLAGFDPTQISHLEQTRSFNSATKDQLMTAIDRGLKDFDEKSQKRFIAIVAEEILERRPDKSQLLQNKLSRLGWNLSGNAVIPIEIFDVSILNELPSESHEDLTKAAQRLRDGDLSGAISSICGALDTVTAVIYTSYNLGDHTSVSFQERCKRSLEAKNIFSDMEQQLGELGWEDRVIKRFCNNFEGAINQGTYVMQTLRSKMGDVHGTKPILKPLVFDSLRWAEIILRLLTDD